MDTPLEEVSVESSDMVTKITLEESFSHIDVYPKQKIQDEVFVADDQQSVIQKLKSFDELHNKERLVYAEHLAELFELAGEEAFIHLEKILQSIRNDSYSIHIACTKQLHYLIELIKRRPDGYQELKNVIIPFLNEFLDHKYVDIKKEISKEIILIAPFLTEKDRGELILSKIVQLAQHPNDSGSVIIAAEMLGNMAQIFGTKLSELFVCKEILSLGIDSNCKVREIATLQLSKICVALSQKYIEQIVIPFFKEKCEESEIGIKEACLEVITSLSKYSSHHVKVTELAPLFFQLIQDQNKDVKKKAYSTLGSFMSSIRFTSQDEDLQNYFLSYYLYMTDKAVIELSKDLYEMLRICAFNFPSVLSSIGKDKWNDLEPIYHQLIKHSSGEVRRPLAYSFHEVARILGPELTQLKLFGLLQLLLKDNSQDVRNGVIKNLSKLIKIFEPERRETFVEILIKMLKEQRKWRSRQMVSVQILHLTQCFDPETVFYVIAPLMFKMCSDQVAEVRKRAARKVPYLLKPFQDGSQEKITIQNHIKGFAISKRFNQRQAYAWMCYKLFNDPIEFEVNFYAKFLEICVDPVKIVRISALMAVDRFIQKNDLQKDKKFLKFILISFKDDKAKEIQEILSRYTFIINKKRKDPQRKSSSKSNKTDGSGGDQTSNNLQ